MPKIKKPSIFFRLFQRKPKLPKTIEIKPASVRMDSGEAKPASARMGYGEAKPGKQIEIKREKSSVEKAGILETMPLAAKDIKKFIKDTYKLIPKIEKREFGVNLMPSELAAKETGNRQYQLAVIVCAIVIPAVIVYASHLLLKSAQAKVAGQIAGREQKLAELNASLKQYEKDQLKNQALRQKLLTAKKLLDDRIYWQGFFDQLEKYTLDGVYYTDLRLDTSGQLTLPVVANSYETGAKQIVAFREAKDFIANVEVNSLTLSGDPKSGATGVSFTVKLSLIDHLFEQPAAATTTADAVAR